LAVVARPVLRTGFSRAVAPAFASRHRKVTWCSAGQPGSGNCWSRGAGRRRPSFGRPGLWTPGGRGRGAGVGRMHLDHAIRCPRHAGAFITVAGVRVADVVQRADHKQQRADSAPGMASAAGRGQGPPGFVISAATRRPLRLAGVYHRRQPVHRNGIGSSLAGLPIRSDPGSRNPWQQHAAPAAVTVTIAPTRQQGRPNPAHAAGTPRKPRATFLPALPPRPPAHTYRAHADGAGRQHTTRLPPCPQHTRRYPRRSPAWQRRIRRGVRPHHHCVLQT